MASASQSGEKKRRGAQPGNLNALKHGFYSRQFSPAELKDLDALVEPGLAGEIALLRVSMRRVMELAGGVEDLDTAIRVLGALSIASHRLSRLLKEQREQAGSQEDGIASAISQALSEVMQELHLE